MILLRRHNIKLNVPDIEKVVISALDLNNKDIKAIYLFDKDYYCNVKEYLITRAKRFVQEYKDYLTIKE